MTKDEALKLALEALENSIDLVSNDAREAELLYGKYQSRLAKVKGLVALEVAHGKAIAAIKEALAQPEQEPVAWVYPEGLDALKAGKPWTAYGTRQEPNNTALYLSPQPDKNSC